VSLKRIMALLRNTYIHWMRMQALVHRMGLRSNLFNLWIE
jgi:hypothetical protein